MGFFKRKSKEQRLFDADQAVKKFVKGKKKLNDIQHKKLDSLIAKRAKATSDVLGIKIGSISYKDAKKFRKGKWK